MPSLLCVVINRWYHLFHACCCVILVRCENPENKYAVVTVSMRNLVNRYGWPLVFAFSARVAAALPSTMATPRYKYLSALESAQIDERLMASPGFSIDQLMELAGLAVATAIETQYPVSDPHHTSVLVVAGPGNNGSDGLVAARHLTHFGYTVEVVYPKRPRGDDATRLFGVRTMPVMQPPSHGRVGYAL